VSNEEVVVATSPYDPVDVGGTTFHELVAATVRGTWSGRR
jgi:hypothetical protein